MDELPEELKLHILRFLPRKDLIHFRLLNTRIAGILTRNRKLLSHLRSEIRLCVPHGITKNGKNITDIIRFHHKKWEFQVQFGLKVQFRHIYGSDSKYESIYLPEEERRPPDAYYYFFRRLFSLVDIKTFQVESALFKPAEEQLCRALSEIDCNFEKIYSPSGLSKEAQESIMLLNDAIKEMSFYIWDYLWRAWKLIHCNDSQRARNSALFAKKYIVCARDIYIPTTPTENDPYMPFFIDGELVHAEIFGEESIEMWDSRFTYKFQIDETEIYSKNKEDTYQFAICCGCRVIDPEDPFAPLNSRSVTSQIISRKKDDPSVHSLALERVALINSERTVGMFRAMTWKNADPTTSIKTAEIMDEALKLANFNVPFLEVKISSVGYKAWVEFADFKHLSVKTNEIVDINEKMLNCGYLNVNAEISNPEELKKFKGFALVVGCMSKNGFTWDRLLEEVQLWKNGTPSSLECVGLFDETNVPTLDEFWDRLEPFSPTGKIPRSNSNRVFEVILLDDENDTAILFFHGAGICFIRGGCEKWKDVFMSTSSSLDQHI